jgi:DNA-binding CsgD family transcriptional regulator/DNA polymerase III delta prime subunit
MVGGSGHLLERTHELAAVDDALQAARAGRGSLTLIEGPPGIGKTELLAAAVARAQRFGLLVLSTDGDELESPAPYAVVRRLFASALTALDPASRDRLLVGAAGRAGSLVDPAGGAHPAPLESAGVLHGLYWLTANMATDGPMLLVVDDLQWSDPGSARWLVYLARRIEGLAVALMVGTRQAQPGGDELLRALRPIAGPRGLQPAPLSVAAVHDLARALLGGDVEHAFSEACRRATGGNPFHVTELLQALRRDRATGTASEALAIDRLAPGTVVDATLARLGRLPSEARIVAEAVALLEPRAELRWITDLTGLHIDAATAAADSLLNLGLLQGVAPCRFEDPILRLAVESAIAPARRDSLHRKAATTLMQADMPMGDVATHLMRTPPLGEPWVVPVLRHAARQASARGSPEAAAGYLRRALAEPPTRQERRELLLDLGEAESAIGSPRAIEWLREALALAENPDQLARVALALGPELFVAGASDEAYELVSNVLERIDASETQPPLELHACLIALAGPAGRMTETAERADALAARAPDGSPAAAAMQTWLAVRAMVEGRHRDHVRGLADGALATRAQLSGAHGRAMGAAGPAIALVGVDELERAEALFTDAIDAASQTGRRRSLESSAALRGYTRRRRGDLAEAERDIEPILASVVAGEPLRPATIVALITQVLVLIDRGRPDAAEALAGRAPIAAASDRQPIVALLCHAQAAAQLAQGKFEPAAATLARVGEVCEANGIRSPVVIPWRSDLSLALAAMDRHAEGIRLASIELRLAERCDVDRARGVALRALGLLTGGRAGLQHLEAAVHVLRCSPARLELGWASFELGAALRRAVGRREARVPLDRALDVALECGAHLLAQRCRDELKAIGARQRSVPQTGVDALTRSERRVCGLASEGLKNADIAQALFVSMRTVETHLSNAYRKLGIRSRTELPRALGATTDPRGT